MDPWDVDIWIATSYDLNGISAISVEESAVIESPFVPIYIVVGIMTIITFHAVQQVPTASSSHKLHVRRLLDLRGGGVLHIPIGVLVLALVIAVAYLALRRRPKSKEPVVVVARDLTPSQTVSFDRERVLGIATEAGGRTSHTAILARGLGLPAVVGAGPAGSMAARAAAAGLLRMRGWRWGRATIVLLGGIVALPFPELNGPICHVDIVS